MAQVRHRVKISATVDPELLDGIDAYVTEHPGTGRSSILDEALALWLAQQQHREMEEQFAGEDAPQEERRQWRRVQREATLRASQLDR
jgi:hypothetical protein